MIYLSSYLFSSMTDESIKNTLIHEIAHALTKGHGHDSVWKRKCIELGGNGQTSTLLNVDSDIKSKYTLTCPCCGYQIPKHRRPKNLASCGKCSNKFNPKYLFIVTENY